MLVLGIHTGFQFEDEGQPNLAANNIYSLDIALSELINQ